MAEYFHQCYRNCTPCVQSNILSEMNFQKILLFLGFWAKNFPKEGETNLAALSSLHCTVQGNILRKFFFSRKLQSFFLKNGNFRSFSNFQRKFFVLLSWKFRQVCQNGVLSNSRNFFQNFCLFFFEKFSEKLSDLCHFLERVWCLH